MTDVDELDGYDPIASAEQAEDGTDLLGIRHNLTLTVAERIGRHRQAAASLQRLEKLRRAPRSSPNRSTP